MDEDLCVKRSIYRELFNDLCADFSDYRSKHNVDTDFLNIEKQLWEFREKSLRMELEDIKQYDDFLKTAKAFLIKKEVFL